MLFVLLFKLIHMSLIPCFILSVQSPADRTQHIHAGDEVVRVNQQTVVSLSNLTMLINKKEESVLGTDKIRLFNFCAITVILSQCM